MTRPDIVIRGGFLVDGSGRPGFEADVAVVGDRIAGVGRYDGPAGEVIDARGKLVTPGFIDFHTHLDAQITWDPLGQPSCWHGVTSVVMGNCGVGFAPCKESDRDYLVYLMEGVEDVPSAAMKEGIPWRWETFGEYTRYLASIPLGPNVGAHVGHCAMRVHAMGERGVKDEKATPADIAAMQELLREAMRGGALGVSTSRTTGHKTPAGEVVPGTFAAPDELMALGQVLAEFNAGVFELAPYGATGEAAGGTLGEVEWMEAVARASARPVRFGLVQNQNHPDDWRGVLARVDAARSRGAQVVPEVGARGVGILLSEANLSPILVFPGAGEYMGLEKQELLAALRRPDVRRALCASLDETGGKILAGYGHVDTVFDWCDEGELSYETLRENSIVARAEREGRHAGEVLIDLMLERELGGFFYIPIFNQDLGVVETMLMHPFSVLGLGDAGAHVGQICDASVPTFTLAYWVRRRRTLTLEHAVKKLTLDPAILYGIRGRGLVRRGWQADLNVIDFERLGVCEPEVSHDFPTGARHLIQRAKGYDATIVNGAVLMRDGVHTGAYPGRVLRNEAVA
jgi:N-acyl-D-aspartate/D-glutamate deacylase